MRIDYKETAQGTAKDAAKVSAEVANLPGPASFAVDFHPWIMTRIQNLKKMYDRPIAPWEHFPKTLTISEMLNPLKIIKEYFNTELPRKKFDKIDQWRDFVLKYDYYNDPNLGPEPLLLVYDENLRFMEAAHLFLLDQNDRNYFPGRISEKDLDVERRKWEYYPVTFSDDEIIDPYMTLESCFKEFPPQLYRDRLHEWLHFALSTQTNYDEVPPDDVITFHESIKHLIDAGWLLRKRLNNH